MKYIQEAFDTNWVAPLGKNVDEFEREMAAYLGVNSAATLVSGTAALHFAVKLAGVKPGDIVFCSDLTFAATVNPVSYEGGKQVFIDSEWDTWNMDPRALEKAFDKYPECKVVIVVNLYGTPAKLDEIAAICKKHGATLIEDAAESLSATYQGKQTGTFGKYSILSFNGNKIITSSGGGMLLSNDEEATAKARFWATQSREQAPWYEHEEIGYNYRMSNIVAGIGRGQLLHLNEHKQAKKRIYERYREGFQDLPVSMNPYIEDSEPNFWLSCLLIDKEAMCPCERTETTTKWEHIVGKTCPDEIAAELSKINAESRPIWKPMHLQPVFKGYDFVTANGSISESVSSEIFERGLCLPSDIKMTEEEQNLVINVIKERWRM